MRTSIANYPKRLPASWAVAPAARAELLVGREKWEIRAAAVSEVSEALLPLAYAPQVASWKRGAPKPADDLEIPAQDLVRLAEALKPERIVPIHTAYPERFASIFGHAEPHLDLEWWAV